MSKIHLLIADDDENIHESIYDMLNFKNITFDISGNFYTTMNVVRYLRKNPEDKAELLILDHDFGGNGLNGLDALPKIRELRPNLPILMLTSFDYEAANFSDAIKKYRIQYKRKPIDSGSLVAEIEMLIQHYNDLQKAQKMHEKEIDEMYELMNQIIEEQKRVENVAIIAEFERDEALLNKVTISPPTVKLLHSVFPNLEFHRAAFHQCTPDSFDDNKKNSWQPVFRTLKIIDQKLENEAGNGLNIGKYKEGSEKNVWEYRCGQGGRIFVQRRQNNDPLILLFAPYHNYETIMSAIIRNL